MDISGAAVFKRKLAFENSEPSKKRKISETESDSVDSDISDVSDLSDDDKDGYDSDDYDNELDEEEVLGKLYELENGEDVDDE
jgi:hypothetical protein